MLSAFLSFSCERAANLASSSHALAVNESRRRRWCSTARERESQIWNARFADPMSVLSERKPPLMFCALRITTCVRHSSRPLTASLRAPLPMSARTFAITIAWRFQPRKALTEMLPKKRKAARSILARYALPKSTARWKPSMPSLRRCFSPKVTARIILHRRWNSLKPRKPRRSVALAKRAIALRAFLAICTSSLHLFHAAVMCLLASIATHFSSFSRHCARNSAASRHAENHAVSPRSIRRSMSAATRSFFASVSIVKSNHLLRAIRVQRFLSDRAASSSLRRISARSSAFSRQRLKPATRPRLRM
mmetsp:Transcript_8232/g.27351  ORF Transcript_8232/g.27351 Transcript_8232/m.27351 type:complete len:307 (-) Transcript_8232:2464-3384(-)